jgi:hypothetical protein
MPTPGGLPKAGEVWERTIKLPPDWTPSVLRFVVLERTGGEYWALRVWVPGKGPGTGRQLWVDPAYWHQRGELAFIGPAGPKTKAMLHLGLG